MNFYLNLVNTPIVIYNISDFYRYDVISTFNENRLINVKILSNKISFEDLDKTINVLVTMKLIIYIDSNFRKFKQKQL